MDNIIDMKITSKYKDISKQMLQLSFPSLGIEEIDEAINYSINKRAKNNPASILNNYKKREVNSTVLEVAEYIMQREPILAGGGMLFKHHSELPNPIANLLKKFMDSRDVYKKEMFKYPKGSEDFEKYNLLQLLAKVDANAFYGAIGQYSCLYYNVNVSTSVTLSGKGCISAACMQFEMFLNNNVKFRSLDEIVTFIYNIINEERQYDDKDILDRDIPLSECFYKVMSICGFDYIPTEDDMLIVWDMMCGLRQTDLNRLYYKNNLYEFMENSSMIKAITYLLETLERPFMNPNKVPKEIKVEISEFCDLLKEYVYYSYQIIDRIGRTENMIRSVVAVIDTDSNFVSLDGWLRFILGKVANKPMPIKSIRMDILDFIEADEFGDRPPISPIEFIDNDEEYDFYNDEVIELEKTINPVEFLPQEGLRYSIINIMAYCLTNIINDYMEKYTKYSNSYEENRKPFLYMKNEFLFKTVMLTDAKKNYATIQELQEGNIVHNHLDLKGLQIGKSGTPKSTQRELKKILYEDILMSKNIDQVKILKHLARCENKIYNSLLNKEKDFYKPVTIKSSSVYEDPMKIQGVKASVVYNAIRDEGMEAIDLTRRNSISILKVDINPKNIYKIKDTYPDKYEILQELFKKKEFALGITTVALPLDSILPDFLVEFINYSEIINDNISSMPLESVGLQMCTGNVNYTNILKL